MDWSSVKKATASPVFTMIGLLVLVIGALLYSRFSRPAPPAYSPQQGAVVQAPPAKKAEKVKPVIVEVPVQGPIRFAFIPKPELVLKLKMPELNAMKDNVIATADVAPHRGKTTVIATIGQGSDNVWTGGIVTRQEPPSFFALEREFHGGLYYGLVGKNVVQGEASWSPARIGPVYPTAKGVVGVEREGGFNGQILVGVGF